jgi:hypothetical protein
MAAAVKISLSGGQNNTNPKGSIGGNRSDTTVTSDVLENLFDNIKRNEALIGRTEYRCVYVYNSSGTPATGTYLEITVNPGVTEISVGLAPEGKGDGRNTGIAESLVTEDQTPTGVRFFGEDINSSDGPWDTVRIPIGFLEAGEGTPVWIKRVSEQGVAQTISLTMVVTHDEVTLPGEDIDDGIAIGELLKVTTQGTGTFVIDTARIGFADIGSP